MLMNNSHFTLLNYTSTSQNQVLFALTTWLLSITLMKLVGDAQFLNFTLLLLSLFCLVVSLSAKFPPHSAPVIVIVSLTSICASI